MSEDSSQPLPPPIVDTATANSSAFTTFSDGTSVPASQVASQVGAFATQNRALPRAPRPALAPANPAVIEKLKGWAISALGGEQLQMPSNQEAAETTIARNKAGGLGASPYLEVYVRQMACRKPDCVPLETVFMLLGNGWHEKTEVLKAADEVVQADVEAAAQLLWGRALQRQVTAETEAGGADDAGVLPIGGGGGGGYVPSSLAEVEADLFTKKALEAAAATFGAGSDGARGDADGGATGAAGGGLVSGSGDLPVVLPRDIAEFEFSEDEVYVVGTNGRKVTVIAGLEHLATTLKELVLRSHVISRMEGLHALVHLTKLELYDNTIEELEELEYLPQLVILDMSYNSIRSMAPVKHCPLLEEIYLAQNKLRTLDGLEGLTSLRKIDIGGNRIRDLSSVAGCVALEELWAGKNKVEALGGCLSGLFKLKRLDVQSNRLTSVEGLVTEAQAESLEELYLARNGISSLIAEQSTSEEASTEGGGAAGVNKISAPLGMLQALHTIDVSSNRLAVLDGLGKCSALEEVWASSNQVEDLARGVRALVNTADSTSPSPANVTCVYLEHNPCAISLGDAEYRKQLKALLPGLTQIDASLA